MDMIERVAREIFYKRTDLEQWHWPTDPPRKWRAPGGALYDSNSIPKGTADRTRDQARAAIEAMREPTEAMLIDGAAKIRNFTSVNGPYPRTRAVWLSMIDASLANRLVLPDSSSGPQVNPSDGGGS
jgi:hypothetical protein